MFDKLVEQKIREAQEAGEFDDLEGAGRAVNLEACQDEKERERLRRVVRDLQLKYDLWVERNGGGLVRSEYP